MTLLSPFAGLELSVDNARSSSVEAVARKRPLRIVHVGKYYPPANGGIETHTRDLARAQAELGADVRVLVVNHRDSRGDDVTFRSWRRTLTVEDSDDRVRIYRVGRLACLAKLDWAPGLLRALRILGRDKPDIWHLHTPNVTMMLALASVVPVCPLVISHHSDIVRQRYLKHAVRPLERLVYGRATRVFASSAQYVNGSSFLQKYLPKIELNPYGIETADFHSPCPVSRKYAAALRRELGSPLWLCVGRLVYYKGMDVAIGALKDMPGKLLVVGEGPMERELRDLAVRMGVADRVIWKGNATQEELIGAYHAATALLFPSNARSESFGLVQVEAMACGCPVINAAIAGSGVSWVSRHGETGLTVPPNDPAALAGAARRFAAEPELREKFSRNAKARVAGEFCFRRMAERSLEAYENVLQFRSCTGV